MSMGDKEETKNKEDIKEGYQDDIQQDKYGGRLGIDILSHHLLRRS